MEAFARMHQTSVPALQGRSKCSKSLVMETVRCVGSSGKRAQLLRASASRSRSMQTVKATLVGPERWTMPSLPGQNGTTSVLQGKDVEESAMLRCIDIHRQMPNGIPLPPSRWTKQSLDDAYQRCAEVTSEYAKTFYLGTQLMTPVQAKAVCAIYVWCRRTDELVDGPNANKITPQALDRWEERLESLFDGKPYDLLDAALTDTIRQFPLEIQPFKDMVGGMRMDLVKLRYQTFDELYEYCYRVAGTVGLMTMPVMGIDPAFKGSMDSVYRAALALGTANQLTNILRDVGEDARERNRIYLPLDELAQFGLTEQDVLESCHVPSQGKVDQRWRDFMKFQIKRARQYFADAEEGVDGLDEKARLPVWSALILYRQILDAIEKNDYDNFSQRAYVSKTKKFASLPQAFLRAKMPRRS